MIKLKNLIDAENLSIGDHFIFGKYQGEPIEWIKIDEHLAISEKILDCVIFDENFQHENQTTTIYRWLDIFASALNMENEHINMLDDMHAMYYFDNENQRKTKATKWAIMHGCFVDDKGYGYYWVFSNLKKKSVHKYIINQFGVLQTKICNDTCVGVRPTIKF